MTLGGLDSDSNGGPGDHLDWWDGTLRPGDAVLVRILEDVPVDPPRRRTAVEAKTDRRSLLRMELAQLEKRCAKIEAELKVVEAAESAPARAGGSKKPRSPSRTKK